MKHLHWVAKDSSDRPAPRPEVAPLEPADSISDSMRRNLSLLRVACESFIPAAADFETDDVNAPVDDDKGRVWVYLPARSGDDENDEIRLLAAELAGQFGLVASVIVEPSSVTVILERRRNA